MNQRENWYIFFLHITDRVVCISGPNQSEYGSNWNWNMPQNTGQGGPHNGGASGPPNGSYAGKTRIPRSVVSGIGSSKCLESILRINATEKLKCSHSSEVVDQETRSKKCNIGQRT